MARDERGSVTAEFAVVVPAVVLVVAIAVGALSTAGQAIRLQQDVAQAARLAARGESEERVRGAVPAAGDVVIRASGDLVCVEATASAALPVGPLRASACALAGGL